jgi:hypothetical protein
MPLPSAIPSPQRTDDASSDATVLESRSGFESVRRAAPIPSVDLTCRDLFAEALRRLAQSGQRWE